MKSCLPCHSCTQFSLFSMYHCDCVLPSVLWHCWLGGRKGIRPVKNWAVGYWHGYLSGARCRLDMAQRIPLPLTVCCFSKIQIGFTFLVSAHPGSPGQRAIKRVCVCIIVIVLVGELSKCLQLCLSYSHSLIHLCTSAYVYKFDCEVSRNLILREYFH